MTVRGSGKFAKLINDFAKETPELARQSINKSTLDLFSKVVMDTPVAEGTLRGNWQVSIAQPNTSRLETTDKDGSETIRKAQAVLNNDNTSHPIFIQNNLPYAKKIEYGGSRLKAPRGMLRKNLTLMNDYLRKAIAELKGGK
jgi:hypothetical protein